MEVLGVRADRCVVMIMIVLVSSGWSEAIDSGPTSHSGKLKVTTPGGVAAAIVSGSTSEIHLGRRIVGERLEQTFRIQNTTPKPVTILQVTKSCGCENSNVTPGMVINAGDTLDVSYEISSQIPGTRRGQLTLHTDSRDAAFATLTLSLGAEILPKLEISPRQVLFRTSGSTQTHAESLEIVIRSNLEGLLKRFQRVEAVSGLVAIETVKSDDTELVLRAILRKDASTRIRRDFIVVHFDDSREPNVRIPVAFQERPRLFHNSSFVAYDDEPTQTNSAPPASSKTADSIETQLPPNTSAGDLLKRMQQVMSLPIRYRVATNTSEGSRRSIALRRLPDSSIAMRLEIPMQISSATTLLFGDQIYKFYQNENMAIDIGYEPEPVREQAEKYAEAINNIIDECDLINARLLSAVTRNGVNLWEVEAGISETRQATFAAIDESGSRESIPVRYRFFIEQDRGVLVELESYSLSGKLLSLMQFADVEVDADLPDEVFQLPPGVEVLVAESIQDYSQMLMTILKKNQPSRLSKPVTEIPGERPWHVPIEQVQQQLAAEREQQVAKARKYMETRREEQGKTSQQIDVDWPHPPCRAIPCGS